MIKELVFTSSYNSQLGALICLSKYFNNKDLNKHSKNIIVFQISSKGDKECLYSCFKDSSDLILGKKFKIQIIKINNTFKRLILLFSLFLIKNLFKTNQLSVWEPAPFWIKRLFIFRGIDLNLVDQYFYKPKYYGDGFLFLSETSIPFWLNKDNTFFKTNYSYGTFYYFYQILNRQNKASKYIKLESSFIKSILKKLSLDLAQEKENFFDNLLIFPLTTFSETLRCSISQEINLYIDYINEHIYDKKTLILIKPHPTCLENKAKFLISKLESQNFNIVNSKLEELIINLPLKVLPLELLCLILVKRFKMKYENISLAINSNASLSTYYLYPKINFIRPFGEKLISKYIKKEYVTQRLLQEKMLSAQIFENNP